VLAEGKHQPAKDAADVGPAEGLTCQDHLFGTKMHLFEVTEGGWIMGRLNQTKPVGLMLALWTAGAAEGVGALAAADASREENPVVLNCHRGRVRGPKALPALPDWVV
jgi:hypothetical protein